jgi:hypothetical protein
MRLWCNFREERANQLVKVLQEIVEDSTRYWKSYVEFHYAMGFLTKNAILIEKIRVDHHEGDDEPKGFQKRL